MWRLRVLIGLILRGDFRTTIRMIKYYLKKIIERSFLGNYRLNLKPLRSRNVEFNDGYFNQSSVKTPIISVIVPHVNYGDYLLNCLNSIGKSTLRAIEVIVIDSGSDERNLHKFNEIKNRFASDSRFKFYNDERRSLGANRNVGIERGTADLFVSVDPDDEIDEKYLELVLFNAIQNCYDVSGASALLHGEENRVWNVARNLVASDFLDRNPIPSNAMFSRRVWERCGGFKDSNAGDTFIHEDWRFWSRASLLGARFGNITTPLSKILIHGSNMSRRSEVASDEIQARLIRKANSDVSIQMNRTNFRKKSILVPTERNFLEILDALSKKKCFSPEEKKTILLFMPWLEKAGVGKVVSELIRGTSSSRFNFIVVTTESKPDFSQPLDLDVQVFHLPELFDKEQWLPFVRWLIATRNVKCTWGFGSTWWYDQLEEFTQMGVQNIDSLYVFESSQTKKNIIKSKNIDLTIFESELIESRYLEAGGRGSTKVIPNGIRLPVENSHKSYQESIYITFVGRMAPEKNPFEFLRIVRLINAQKLFKSNVSFLMIGGGPLLDSVIKEIDEKNLPVFHLGPQENVDYYLQKSLLLVQTSTEAEGRPNVVIEAIANGVPVVAYDSGAVSELFKHGESGFLHPRGDLPGMIDSIVTIVKDAEIWNDFSLNALSFAKNNFQLESIMKSYIESLEKLHLS